MNNTAENMISVIVPVYNVERYLNRCVDSIINQTYKNIEIILVDDGSSDNSGIICDYYQNNDSRIKVIHQKNEGLSYARNVGIDSSEGKFLFFLDSDDFIENDAIEILYDELMNNYADISVCAAKKLYDDGEFERYGTDGYFVLLKEEALEHCLFKHSVTMLAWGKLYKKFLFDGIRFPVGKINEDEFVTYKVVERANKVVYIGKELYVYRSNASSIMKSGIKQKKLHYLEAWCERELFLRQKKYDFFADKTIENIIRELYLIVNEVDNEYAKVQISNAVKYVELKIKEVKLLPKDYLFRLKIKLLIIKYKLWRKNDLF